MDAEQRLASLDEELNSTSMMSDLFASMEETIPGLGEMFASLSSGLEQMMQSTRLSLEAEVAQKNGDLELAESKYIEALSKTDEDRISGVSIKISILCSLGELKHLQGDDGKSESLLKEAFECATEYAEAEPSIGNSSLLPVLVSLASFMKDVGRHEESEQHFKSALKLQRDTASEYIEKYSGNAADYCGQEADIKEKYAELLRVLKRDEEAAQLEAETNELKKAAETRQAELKARRAKLNPEQ
jgi:tetratricopeptide (TPR) repeat protein